MAPGTPWGARGRCRRHRGPAGPRGPGPPSPAQAVSPCAQVTLRPVIAWLRGNAPFPPVDEALKSPNGLLCAGGDLSPARILDAYAHGIFPWFSEGDPILWWSPDPRMVLFPGELRVSHSL